MGFSECKVCTTYTQYLRTTEVQDTLVGINCTNRNIGPLYSKPSSLSVIERASCRHSYQWFIVFHGKVS